MKINDIRLENFRCFKDKTTNFHPKLQVLVGETGTGKTAILEAVRMFLEETVEYLTTGKSTKTFLPLPNRIPTYREYMIHDRFGQLRRPKTTLAMSTNIQGSLHNWYLYLGDSLTGFDMDLYPPVQSIKQSGFSLLRYYSHDRSNKNVFIAPFRAYKNWDDNICPTDAYEDCFQSEINIKEIAEWFSYKGAEEPLVLVKARKALVGCIEGLQYVYYEPLKFDLFFVFENNDVKPLSLLSGGQKSVVYIVLDLLQKCIMLNHNFGFGGKVFEKTEGVVLIDNIENNLSPSQQYSILPYLQKTFPNIQFIVTTTSPFICSTVDKECIKVLGVGEDGVHYEDTPRFQTKGSCASDILEQIMSTFSSPQIEESRWLVEYNAMILEDCWDSPEGEELFTKIVNHFGEDHPEVLKLKGDIRTQNFKLKFAKIKNKE